MLFIVYIIKNLIYGFIVVRVLVMTKTTQREIMKNENQTLYAETDALSVAMADIYIKRSREAELFRFRLELLNRLRPETSSR
jgi:hypothetical protein